MMSDTSFQPNAMKDFAGRTALVSGASGGIGQIIALELAERGAAVGITGRNIAQLESTRAKVLAVGSACVMSAADLNDDDDIDLLMHSVVSRIGAVDVLINCAGMAGPTAAVTEIATSEFEETLRVNVVAAFALCRAVVPGMRGLGRGSIINIGSVAGVEAFPFRSPYATSKWALEGLTRTLAAELGPEGIRVNIVSPGPTEGDRASEVMARAADVSGRSIDAVRAQYESRAPLRRFVTAREVARMVAFLASETSSGTTGQSIRVSGGLEI